MAGVDPRARAWALAALALQPSDLPQVTVITHLHAMPTGAPHECGHPGCKILTTARRCPTHAGDGRPSARERGYDAAWQRTRAQILKRDPRCKVCHVKQSTNVDHIVPRAIGGSDRPDNLQGLCAGCHSAKTARRDGGFGRRRA